MCNTSFHIATIFSLLFFFFPFWILSNCLPLWVVRIEEWEQCYQEAISVSMKWGSRPQKNGWVANSCLGKQTNTAPVCLYTMCRLKPLLPLGQLYGYTNTSPLPVIQLKSGLMASNSISAILNQSNTGNWLLFITGCNITSNYLFSSLCVIYGGDFEPWIDVLQLQWAILE